ncbi:MAG TPA: ABC-2 transporter permease [Steroidobacteraceae bacterium]|nr:ABC-2 transporter permease [Steroidobacteraceae bacterium]
MNTVTRKLIAKELYVNRLFIVCASIAGIVSVLLCTTSKVGFNVGALIWISTIVAVGVMLALYGIMNERKENSLLFVMSLPLSIPDYVRAKQLGLAACFAVPWLISSAAALIFVLAHPGAPDGLLPYLVLLCVFLFSNYSLVLCGALHARSEAVTSAVVIVTNMAVTLFMFLLGGLDEINKYMWGPTPVWNHTFWAVLAAELATLALAFALPWFFAARRRDFI